MGRKSEPVVGLTTKPSGTWVQTDRAAHEKMAILVRTAPTAAALLHTLIARTGRHNAVIISQKNLARLLRCTVRTVQRSLEVLVADSWIEVRQLGAVGTTNAYILNDRVVWSGKRDGIRYSMFSAAVMVSDDDQQDKDTLTNQPPLWQVPEIFPGEQQLPTGDGLPPPSQPSLHGLEHDLPTRKEDLPLLDAIEAAPPKEDDAVATS